ncbi:orotidine-5'-phosphate decarboxylase [Acuticoccus sp. MNP-M23]|uniref:orotidine-5'-phosphate decarboxylase n=1 Tax=Acuticoccus sp. MNP-M23 TaxID=3072793 RepID=UPI002815D190|nr:orotidine-5'-phosphate decarboxylase [Acuticoccus sp. MNP-M23]WMS44178.1 orotidine-5'-phosphate decarboxylase [Acuticoccus sp. MNP-M23]
MIFDTPKSRLILALDFADTAKAEALVKATEGMVGVYKIGFECALAGGIDLARELVESGHHVFLDMKLLDIANTVASAVRSAGKLGVDFLTVHAYPQAIAAAVAARPEGLQIVAVTVLTSLDDGDLAEAGYALSTEALAKRRIETAAALGADCIVCSPREAVHAHRSGLTVITPGVRLPEDSPGDQKRVATPQVAIRNGADAVVVGRPINASPAPDEAAARYVEAIREGLASRPAKAAAPSPKAARR